MEGMISSDCYEGKDWAGSDRKRFYADLVPMKAYNQSNGSVYPSQSQLQEAVPDFDWSGGHSGCLLNDNQQEKLDEFLKSFTTSPEYSANDIHGVRSRDYAIPPSLIHTSEKESECYPVVDPRPLIESLVCSINDIKY